MLIIRKNHKGSAVGGVDNEDQYRQQNPSQILAVLGVNFGEQEKLQYQNKNSQRTSGGHIVNEEQSRP